MNGKFQIKTFRKLCAFLLLGLFCLLHSEGSILFARDEWFRRLDLERGLAEASLVLAARVGEITETKLIMGGKGEQFLKQFKFEPLKVLKGVFSREALLLTSNDLGGYQFSGAADQIERGQVRLLILGRSHQGFAVRFQAPSQDQLVPPLQDVADPLLETVKVLLLVNESHDRAKKVSLLLDGLGATKGPGAISLLKSLERRALLAAQTSGVVPKLAGHLAEASPAVREAAAHMLQGLPAEVRANVFEALRKIDTREAAKALQPHLGKEADLLRKLEIAEFLGRHGIPDGYPYAIEHMAEPHLLEQAIKALAAIRDPKAATELRNILNSSTDVAWRSASLRALGLLGEAEFVPQLLEIAQDLKNPLAASALIALGDLKEAKALDKVREGLSSRNPGVVTAGARAAGQLLGRPDVKADDLRDRLTSLLADADAAQEARAAALDSLLQLQDQPLDQALSKAVRDARLEDNPLLERIEKLLRDRRVRLTSL